MKNAYSLGNVLEYTAASPIQSGQVVKAKSLTGIAIVDIAAGEIGAVAVEGVFSLPKQSGQSFLQGERVYLTEDGEATAEYTPTFVGYAFDDAIESDAEKLKALGIPFEWLYGKQTQGQAVELAANE